MLDVVSGKRDIIRSVAAGLLLDITHIILLLFIVRCKGF